MGPRPGGMRRTRGPHEIAVAGCGFRGVGRRSKRPRRRGSSGRGGLPPLALGRFPPVFAKKIGIDLGTASTRVYVRGEGIVLDEPSLAAVETGTPRVLAIGRHAAELADRTPGQVALVSPMRDGAIADRSVVEQVQDRKS